MNEQFSNVIVGVAAALGVAWMAVEIRRRREHLEAMYNLLDENDRHLCVALEQMIEDGVLSPHQAQPKA